ncbi:LysE family translocator [bacterium]|nr:LysE family translocator [bacterium]
MTDILGFLVAALIIELTPGPNMTWLAILAATRGRTAALSAVAGVALGLALLGGLAALGLAAIVATTPLLWEALRWLGAAYLLWLAWETWTGPTESTAEAGDVLHGFRRGLIVNALNPKAAAVFLTLIPRHVSEPAHWASLFAAAMVYVAVATLIHALIVAFASNLHGLFKDPLLGRRLRIGFALALIGVAVWSLFSTAR